MSRVSVLMNKASPIAVAELSVFPMLLLRGHTVHWDLLC